MKVPGEGSRFQVKVPGEGSRFQVKVTRSRRAAILGLILEYVGPLKAPSGVILETNWVFSLPEDVLQPIQTVALAQH